jgi:serine/threonine protein kinase
MSNNNTYKLKYYKYKNKYNTLKQQQGGVLTHTSTHDVYSSHDGIATCQVPISDAPIAEGKYGVVYKCGDDVVKTYKYDEQNHGELPEKYAERVSREKKMAIHNCHKEYKIMELLIGVPGVVQVHGHDCDDAHSMLIESYEGNQFTYFLTLHSRIRTSIAPYIKAFGLELAHVIYYVNATYDISHCDLKLANILVKHLEYNLEHFLSGKITDFGLSCQSRDQYVILNSDPDILDTDIPKYDFQHIPHVQKYSNTLLHSSFECKSIFEIFAIFNKDPQNPGESIALRKKYDLRPMLAIADAEPLIGQMIQLALRIRPKFNGGSYLRLYDTVIQTNADMVEKLKQELRSKSFDIQNGIICLKTESDKKLTDYESIDYFNNNDQLAFLEQSYAIAQEMAGGKITKLPIREVADLEGSLRQMRDALQILNKQPCPFIKITEDDAGDIRIPVQHVTHIPPEQIRRDVYERKINPPQQVSKEPPQQVSMALPQQVST